MNKGVNMTTRPNNPSAIPNNTRAPPNNTRPLPPNTSTVPKPQYAPPPAQASSGWQTANNGLRALGQFNMYIQMGVAGIFVLIGLVLLVVGIAMPTARKLPATIGAYDANAACTEITLNACDIANKCTDVKGKQCTIPIAYTDESGTVINADVQDIWTFSSLNSYKHNNVIVTTTYGAPPEPGSTTTAVFATKNGPPRINSKHADVKWFFVGIGIIMILLGLLFIFLLYAFRKNKWAQRLSGVSAVSDIAQTIFLN